MVVELAQAQLAAKTIAQCFAIIQHIMRLKKNLDAKEDVGKLFAKVAQAEEILKSFGQPESTGHKALPGPGLLEPLVLRLQRAQDALQKAGATGTFGWIFKASGSCAICVKLEGEIDEQLMILNHWKDVAARNSRADEESPEGLLAAGLKDHEMKRYVDACEKFRKASVISQEDSRVWYHWGCALLADRQCHAAASKFEEADRRKPNDAEILRQWGLALGHDEKDQDSQKVAFEKLWAAREAAALNAPLASSILVDLAEVLRNQAEDYAAEICLGEAAVLNPKNFKALWEWAIVLFDQDKECLRKFEDAHRVCPDNTEGLAVWSLALVYHARKSSKLSPDDVSMLQEEALRHCQEALKVEKNNGRALHAWGMVLSDQKHFEKAVQKFSASIAAEKKNANVASANYELGQALSGLQQHQEAIEKFKLCLKKDEDEEKDREFDGNALKGWAEALKVLNKTKDAAKKFEEAAAAFGEIEMSDKAQECKILAEEMAGKVVNNPYITVNRIQYSKELWNYAKEASQTKSFTLEDAKHLWGLATVCGKKMTEVERRTFEKILTWSSLMNDASAYLSQKLQENPRKLPKKIGHARTRHGRQCSRSRSRGRMSSADVAA